MEGHPQTGVEVGSGKPRLSRDLKMLLLCGTRADFAESGFPALTDRRPPLRSPLRAPCKSGQVPPPPGPRESSQIPAPQPPSLSDDSSVGRGLARGQGSQAEAPTAQTPSVKRGRFRNKDWGWLQIKSPPS